MSGRPAGGPGPAAGPRPAGPRPLEAPGPAGPRSATGSGAQAGAPVRSARSELRRQMREQRRIRAVALATVVALVLGAPIIYFGILFATRDPVLNSLDRLEVPAWAARSPEDRIITGSRWCIIDCRFRQRTLESTGEPAETTEAYQAALVAAGWTRWDVPGCPQVEVDGDYSCWTRDEYTLDLWVRPPECAYDPLNLRPELEEEAEDDAEEEDAGEGDPDAAATGEPDAQECSGSVVEIKMQNRVSDERGLPGKSGEEPVGPPGESPSAGEPTGSPTPSGAP